MAKATLPTNYQDDILNVSTEGKRKYRMVYNDDGTVSFDDVTPYDQEGSDFGAGDINATNEAVNQSLDKAKVIDDLETIQAVTNEGFVMGALAGKALNESLGGVKLGIDGEGNRGYFGADDRFIPFSGGMHFIIKGEFAAKENTFNPTIAFTNNGNKTVTLNKISTTNTIEYIIVKDGISSTIMSTLNTPTDVIDISNAKEVSVRITSPSSWQKIEIEFIVE